MLSYRRKTKLQRAKEVLTKQQPKEAQRSVDRLDDLLEKADKLTTLERSNHVTITRRFGDWFGGVVKSIKGLDGTLDKIATAMRYHAKKVDSSNKHLEDIKASLEKDRSKIEVTNWPEQKEYKAPEVQKVIVENTQDLVQKEDENADLPPAWLGAVLRVYFKNLIETLTTVTQRVYLIDPKTNKPVDPRPNIHAWGLGGNSTSGTSDVVSTKNALTPASPTNTSVGTSSAEAVAANANRKGLYLVNTSDETITLGFGVAAELDKGMVLTPGGVYTMDEYSFNTNAVNAIATGAASNLAIQEFS